MREAATVKTVPRAVVDVGNAENGNAEDDEDKDNESCRDDKNAVIRNGR